MSFYSVLAATARQLIRSKGIEMTLLHLDASRSKTHGVIGAFPIKEISSQVLRSDKRIILEADAAPSTEDILIIGSQNHSVMDWKPIAPGGVDVVIYIVQARAGG